MEFLKKEIEAGSKRPGHEELFLKTKNYFTETVLRLEKEVSGAPYEEIPINYSHSARELLKNYPKQAVLIFSVLQKDSEPIVYGFVSPESSLIVSKRSEGENKWGSGQLAVPMGKIDESDYDLKDDKAGTVVLRAAGREVKEELKRNDPGGYFMIVGSFLDRNTGFLVHIVFEDIGSVVDKSEKYKIGLPDQREHSDAGWMAVGEFSKLESLDMGLKFALLVSFRYLERLLAESHHFLREKVE